MSKVCSEAESYLIALYLSLSASQIQRFTREIETCWNAGKVFHGEMLERMKAMT